MSNIDFYLFRVLDRFELFRVLLPRASKILLLHTIVILRSLSNLTGISTLGLANRFFSRLYTQTVGVVSSSQSRDSDLEGGELISLFDGN